MLRAPFALLFNILKFLRFLWAGFWIALFSLFGLLGPRKRSFVTLKLESNYAFGPGRGLAAIFQSSSTFLDFRESIKRLAKDRKLEGVVIIIDDFSMGPARVEEFRDLFSELRRAGKRVVVHFQNATLRDYALATVADEILVTPAGRLYMFGLRFEQYFAADLLERIGVAVQFVHIGPFKTASHRFIHSHMTDPQRLMMQNLFDSLTSQYEDQITRARNIETSILRTALHDMPIDTRDAMRHGLIDGECFRQNISQWLTNGQNSTAMPGKPAKEKRHSSEPLVKLYPAEPYLNSQLRLPDWTPLFRPTKRMAVLDLTGMIVMPNMSLPGTSTTSINPTEIVPRLRALKKNPNILGVLLHINSPGGSALASDLLWQAIQDLRAEKPVVAYCSDVAASGGYYLAVAADQIICRAQTVTGSIGVIAGKMSFPGTLEHAKINVESIDNDDTTSFSSLTTALTPHAMQNLQTDARSFYRRFLQRVGQARKLSKRRLHRYARGRVYTGQEAFHRGLVDHLGGFDFAVEQLAKICNTDAQTTPLEFVSHRHQTLKSLLRNSLVQSPTAHGLLNSIAPQLASAPLLKELNDVATATAMLRSEPVLAWMPVEIHVGQS